MSDIPWVIRGEPGPHTLTKWDGDTPLGYEPWCGTCGWHGDLSPYTTPEGEAAAIMATYPQAQAHVAATGHRYPDDEPLPKWLHQDCDSP